MDPNVVRVRRELERRHKEAVDYAVRYGHRWDRVTETYVKLQAFRMKLARQKAHDDRSSLPLIAA